MTKASRGKTIVEKEENTIINTEPKIQLEHTPHLFQLATLPPAWTCMVDI